MALESVEAVRRNGRVPFFVGGTGLYIDSLMKGIAEIPEIDSAVREELHREMEEKGPGPLHERLMEVDPEFARSVHPNDRQRTLRGLEVFRGTGTPLSVFYRSTAGYESRHTAWIGLREERSALIRRIDRRVDAMIREGFVEEVAHLRERGCGPELKSMKSIGYAEINRHLDGEMDRDTTVEKIKTSTHRYAKRQMTWFRRNERIRWFTRDQGVRIRDFVERWHEQGEHGSFFKKI